MCRPQRIGKILNLTPFFAFRACRAVGLGFCLLTAANLSGCAVADGTSQIGSSLSEGISRQASNVGGLFSSSTAAAYNVPIFVVSTRRSGAHSAELTPGAQARYALNFVSVPPGHVAGAIEMPSFGSPDARRHFAVSTVRALEDDSFGAEIAAHVSGRIGVNRDVLVYVHGFNTSFEEARFRLAQIAVDGKFGGVAVLFTWPSKSELLAYGADKESATASRDAYFKLLNQFADTPGVGRIHILAHSMGTWLTMETLRESALAGAPDLRGHLGDVMLAAPDIDLSVFKQQIARLDPSHFSIFVAKGDRALQISASIQGDRRLGAIDPNSDADRDMIEKLGVKVFDVSDMSRNLIGHDSFTAASVIRSIGAQIAEPRTTDGSQAVIDAGADRSERPAPPPPLAAITSEEPPPIAAEPVNATAPAETK
jgi:esterase/lipase superfamily enzyme